MTTVDESKQAAAEDGSQASMAAVATGLVVLFGLCFLFSWRPLATHSDFWAHAAVGRWIWSAHTAPTHALFLWTSNIPWIAHSWLSELLIYTLMRAGGETGGPSLALAAVTLMSFAAVSVLWLRCRVKANNAATALTLFIVGIYCAGERFMPRPEIFSTLLFAVVASVLLDRDSFPDRRKGDAQAVRRHEAIRGIGLALLFVLWTNLHGAVINGLILVWTYAITALLQDHDARARRSAMMAAACSAATLINPYGYHYYSIYRAVSSLTFSQIPEWRPLFSMPNVPAALVVALCLLIVAAVYCWFITPNRRWANLVWVVIFAVLTLTARRNIVYFTLACLAAIAAHFAAKGRPGIANERPATSGRRSRSRRSSSMAAVKQPDAETPLHLRVIWTCAAVGAAVFAAWTPIMVIRQNGLISTVQLATGIADAVKSCGITGRVFNDYDYGAYLDWRFGGSPSLSIDNLNAYPDSVEQDTDDIMRANQRGMALLDSDNVDCIIGRRTAPYEPDYPQLYITVSESPKWALAYFGDDGPVWVRRLPQYSGVWEGVPVFTGHNMDDFLQYLHTCPHIAGDMTPGD